MLDLFSLQNKNALVTGASAGLGAALARALAGAGANVACHGNTRSPDATADAVRQMGRNALSLSADLSDKAAPDKLMQEVLSEWSHIDILINNAATIRRAPAAEYTDEDWETVLEVNLTSVWKLSRAAGRHFLERKQSGKIVNIASMLSFQGGITVPAYAAAKGGVMQLTKALSNEWAAHDICVNAIAPGYFRTDNTAALQANETRNRQILERIPAGRWGEPDDLAGAVVFLSSRASDYMHGHTLVVDGGWLGR